MSRTTNESDNRAMSKDHDNSPSINEGSSGGSMAGGNVSGGAVMLKKGPWTSAEDAILIDYVQKHGEGNWNAVQKHTGLARCGKSCRLRWANHLRPHLKKGAFTPEEEKLIVELHAKMGNKWARMAAQLPGRTDNEIKNFWNTRIKRRQRAGLPLYPPNVSLENSNEDQQSAATGDFNCGQQKQIEIMHGSNFDIAGFKIDNFIPNQGLLSYGPPLPDIPFDSMLCRGFGPGSRNYSFLCSNRVKRRRDSETLSCGFSGNIPLGLSTFQQFPSKLPEKVYQPFALGFQHDPDPGSKRLRPFEGTISGSHANMNGNHSTSRALTGTVKMELPSLQYQRTDLTSWLGCPSPPPLEPVDSYVQLQPSTETMQSDHVSPRHSGLLDAMIPGAKTRSSAMTQPSENSSNASDIRPIETLGSSTVNIYEPHWDVYSDPISPLGCSAASVLSENTPVSGSSLDELSALNAGGDFMFDLGRNDTSRVNPPRSEFLRPDALLASDWLEESFQNAKDTAMLSDSIATLLGEDFSSDITKTAMGAFIQGKVFDPYGIHEQMSENL